MIRKGDVCWLVESNRRKRQVVVLKVDQDFATVGFLDSDGGIRVRLSRLYGTAKEADQKIQESVLDDPGEYDPPVQRRKKNQYDYMW